MGCTASCCCCCDATEGYQRLDGDSHEKTCNLEDFPTSFNNPSIPVIVEKCVMYIEQKGLQADGIFRVPGTKHEVNQLTARLQNDMNTDIRVLDIHVNAVATTLKQFFIDLTEPLIPVLLYTDLINAIDIQDKDSQLDGLKTALHKLSDDQKYHQNFEVLKYLMAHLHRITEHCNQNNMNSSNLAKCWWPTLLRMELQSYTEVGRYSQIFINITQTMIEQYRFLF